MNVIKHFKNIFYREMSLVGREEVRMVIHCAWGLEYGSKPKLKALPMTMSTVFSNTVFMCCFLFPLCYEWPIRALNPL